MPVIISGSSGITNVDGTASAPSETGTTSTNTGMWYPAANTVAWSTGGSERMRVDSSGNVGVGTSSPAGKLDVNGNIYVSGKQITNGPAFSAYGSALQSISNVTATKIAFNTKIFDTNSNYDATTNYRFTPTVAGYYLITAAIGWNGSATGYTSINIYKNGSNAFNGGYVSNSSVGPVVTASSIFLANGTTDYFEIYATQSSGGALNGGSNAAAYTFSGCLIRGA